VSYSHTPEQRARISATLKVSPAAVAARAALHDSQRGVPRPPEVRARISAATMGHRDYVATAPVKGECVYCGRPASGYDHVIPRGRPGWDDPENLVPSCRSCNTSKGPRTPDEWFAAMVSR
jgi:5-methylcytosine-specific restriction endonuclease McrA